MNKFIVSTLATVMCVSTFSVIAATTVENTDDGSAIGSSESPQIKEQDKRIDKKATNKSLKRNGTMSHNDKEMKAMDTDSNGMVSKDEYILYHEKMYDKMKQKNGGVSYKNSMNNKPMGTTTGESQNGSVDITKKDGPINGTTTGTNQQLNSSSNLPFTVIFIRMLMIDQLSSIRGTKIMTKISH